MKGRLKTYSQFQTTLIEERVVHLICFLRKSV